MATLRSNLGSLVLLLCIGVFAWWQIRDSAQKDAKLEAQAETIRDLKDTARRIDEGLLKWRKDNEDIANDRQQTKLRTNEAARRDPALKEQLDMPLHPALRPGGGLLGRQRGSPSGAAPGPDGAHPGP